MRDFFTAMVFATALAAAGCWAAFCPRAEAQQGNIAGLPKPWTGSVSSIVDGDGIYVDGSEFQIRLLGVDAPDRGQTGYDEATATLEMLVTGKQVRVDPQYWQPPTVRYSARIVGRVWIGDVGINRRVIDAGPAKEDCEFSKGLYGHC